MVTIGEVTKAPERFPRPRVYAQVMKVVAQLKPGEGFKCTCADTDELRRVQINVLGTMRRERLRGKFCTRRVPGELTLWIIRCADEERE